MIDISELKIGDKVHYYPFEGCDDSLIENGMVKSIPNHTNTSIFVVFNCAGEWYRFREYTAQLTPIENLKTGWWHGE